MSGKDFTDFLEPKHDSYASRHNGFVYFHSVIDNQAYCNAHVVALPHLQQDLSSPATTPNLSFVTPNTCNDAHDTPKCQDGSKGGLGKANAWLQRYVPMIMDSAAYKQDGLIVITFDESGDDSDAGACCGEVSGLGLDDPAHPNTNEPGLYGPGGGRVGAVLLSRFIKPGTTTAQHYNHYSLLRSVEDIFGVAHLGDAKQAQVRPFGADVYTEG